MDLSMIFKEEAKQQDKLITAEIAFPLSPPSSDYEQIDNQASTSTVGVGHGGGGSDIISESEEGLQTAGQ